VDVDPKCEFPLVVIDLLDLLERRLVRSVVDEDVDAAELGNCFLNNVAAVM
jgi:hypothetical protein